MILLITSLVAGFLTVLAPCTIALLPVIIGGSLSGSANFRRTLTIIISLGLSVIIFTLALKASTTLIAVPESFWQGLSGAIVVILGLTMLFPALWEKLSFLSSLNSSSNQWLAVGFQKQNTLGDIVIGASLGPVFSSCSPTYFLILATVLPRSIVEGLFYLLVYTLGLCIGLLIVARASQSLMDKLGAASDARSYVKRGIGALFVILGLLILTGYEKKMETFLSEHVYDVTTIEQRLLKNADMGTSERVIPMDASPRVQAKAVKYDKAPEITGASGYINTNDKPITFGEFKDKKVVLVDFWTYSCINCQRTIPYLTAWDERYRDKGLVIIGIHTPEFAFEKLLANVKREVENTFHIKYPVVLDNDFAIWSAFGNHYWPRKYLIDVDGYIVYDHIGEGNYEETEMAIQRALEERAEVLGLRESAPTDEPIVLQQETESGRDRSPETYFGASRNEFLRSGTPKVTGIQKGVVPTRPEQNKLYLKGSWNIHDEYAENTEPASIFYYYSAKDVHFVARSAQGAKLRIYVDGKPLGALRGTDVSEDSTITITRDGLYNLIKGDTHDEHILEIRVESGTLEAYTFTFG